MRSDFVTQHKHVSCRLSSLVLSLRLKGCLNHRCSVSLFNPLNECVRALSPSLFLFLLSLSLSREQPQPQPAATTVSAVKKLRCPGLGVYSGFIGNTYLLYPLPSIHKDGPVHVHTLTQNRVSKRIGYSGCFPPDMQAVLQRVWRRRSGRHCRGGVGDRWTPTSTSTGSRMSISRHNALKLAGK